MVLHSADGFKPVSQHGSPHTVVRFGVFEVDLANSELRKSGVRLRLQEQPFQVLLALLERPGEVITREELISRLWPDGTHVDFDRGLNAAVTRLRQVLSDSAETPRYIETVPKRGYRLITGVELGPETFQSQPEQPSKPVAKSWPSLWSRIAVAVVVGAALAWLWLQQAPGELKLRQLTRDSGLATEPAFSPDGKLVAYASDRGSSNLNLWVKQVADGGHAIQLTNDQADSSQPSFSPDGKQIVYRSERDGGGIYTIPSIGGEPVLLAKLGRNPVFSPDGKWIAYWATPNGVPPGETPAYGWTYLLPASGGEPQRVGLSLPPGGLPVWSPDSEQLLVFANSSSSGASGEQADWWTVPLNGGPGRKTGAYAALESQGFSLQFLSTVPRAALWTGDGLVFSGQKGDSFNVWKVPFNGGKVSGTAERLTQGTTREVYASQAGNEGTYPTLAFASLSQTRAIWSLPLDANNLRVKGDLQRLTEGDTSEVAPSMSADGRLLTYGSTSPGHADIWVKNLETGKSTMLTGAATSDWHPLISADGSMVAYTVQDDKRREIYVVPASGGVPKRVAAGSGWLFAWTPDNRGLLYHHKSPEPFLRKVDLDSGKVSVFLERAGANLFQCKFSPDRKWMTLIAITRPGNADKSESRVFIVKLENDTPVAGTEWIPVSDEREWADKPRWAPDGNSIYFTSGRDGFHCLWAQRLEPLTKRAVGNPVAISHFHSKRLSLENVGFGLVEMDIAADKLVVSLGELTGNIWTVSRQ